MRRSRRLSAMFSAGCGMISATRAPGQGSPLGSGRDEASTGAAVRSMFAAVAPRYDFLNHFLSLGRDIAWRRATARALKDILARPGSRVADLCCGTGDLSFCLGRHSQGLVMGRTFATHAGDRAWQSRCAAPDGSTFWRPTRSTCLLPMRHWTRSRPLSDFAIWPIIAGELKRCGGS